MKLPKLIIEMDNKGNPLFKYDLIEKVEYSSSDTEDLIDRLVNLGKEIVRYATAHGMLGGMPRPTVSLVESAECTWHVFVFYEPTLTDSPIIMLSPNPNYDKGNVMYDPYNFGMIQFGKFPSMTLRNTYRYIAEWFITESEHPGEAYDNS